MKKFLNDYLAIVTVCIIILTLVAINWSENSFSDDLPRDIKVLINILIVIAGCCLSFQVKILRDEFKSENLEEKVLLTKKDLIDWMTISKKDLKDWAELKVKTFNSEIRNLYDIEKSLLDKRLSSFIKTLLTFLDLSKINIHEREVILETLNDKLLECKQIQGNKKVQELSEHKRISKVTTAIENAQDYIFAITFDSDDYMKNFWEDIYDYYLAINTDAKKRGVQIERIFVLNDDKPINEIKEDKEFIVNMMNFFEKYEINIPTWITSTNKIKDPELAKSNTSIIICDDIFISETKGISDGIPVKKGYFSLNDHNKLRDFKDRFEGYKTKGQRYFKWKKHNNFD